MNCLIKTESLHTSPVTDLNTHTRTHTLVWRDLLFISVGQLQLETLSLSIIHYQSKWMHSRRDLSELNMDKTLELIPHTVTQHRRNKPSIVSDSQIEYTSH